MAKDPSKTEEPTQKRINKTREEGNVMTSQDVTGVVMLIAGAAAAFASLGRLATGYYDCLKLVLDQMLFKGEWDAVTIKTGTYYGAMFLGKLLLPMLLFLCIAAIVVVKAQVGPFFSMKPLEWKFDKLNPVGGIKNVLPSAKNAIKLLMALVKVIIVGTFVYLMFREKLDDIIYLPTLQLPEALRWISTHMFLLVIKIFAFFVVVAIIDYFYKRHDYFDNLKMSKQEVKDERKDAEGDPQVKGQQRKKMMEMTMLRMIAEVPKADVVVTNPTHVAIALKYTPGTYAPRVVAKGLRKRALRIKQIAAEHDVPIVEAPPLARSLYRHVPLGGFIPEHLFAAVAGILAKIHAKRRKKREAILNHGLSEATAS